MTLSVSTLISYMIRGNMGVNFMIVLIEYPAEPATTGTDRLSHGYAHWISSSNEDTNLILIKGTENRQWCKSSVWILLRESSGYHKQPVVHLHPCHLWIKQHALWHIVSNMWCNLAFFFYFHHSAIKKNGCVHHRAHYSIGHYWSTNLFCTTPLDG